MFSDAFQGLEEMTSKDEIVFGEIIRLFVKKGHPMIGFSAQSGKQSARFLMNGEVLFALRVTLDKMGFAGFLKITAEVRNKLADPDDMISMFKTDLSNVLKVPLLGAIKVNHEYNTIYATSTSVKKISSYFIGKGTIDRDVLAGDMDELVKKLEEALRKFKKV